MLVALCAGKDRQRAKSRRQTVLSRVPTVCAVRGPWMVESMRGVGCDANREQSHPQRREQCIRQQSRRSSALERGVVPKLAQPASGWGSSRDHEGGCFYGLLSTVLPRSTLVIGRAVPSMRACPTQDLPRTTTERSIDELKARYLRLPRNRPCIGAANHVFSRKNRVYSPKAHRWV